MTKEIYWVAGPKNYQYPLRLHKIEEAARLADDLKATVFIESYPNRLEIVYSQGESEVLSNLI